MEKAMEALAATEKALEVVMEVSSATEKASVEVLEDTRVVSADTMVDMVKLLSAITREVLAVVSEATRVVSTIESDSIHLFISPTKLMRPSWCQMCHLFCGEVNRIFTLTQSEQNDQKRT